MLDHTRPSNGNEGLPPAPEETVRLLDRVRSGDERALEDLLARILPRLRRWAHGRLPRASRSMLDTGDIVQTVAARAVRQLARLEIDRSAALGYYLRQAVMNELATQWRQADRRPIATTLAESLPADQLSPVELLIGAERLQQYEEALARLEPHHREAIVGRFELVYSYEELARFLGKPTEVAARVAVHRALKRLTEQVRRA